MRKGCTSDNIKLIVLSVFSTSLFFQTVNLHAREEISAEQLFSMDLADLLNVKFNVASNKDKTIREQPGIVTIVLAEEIQKSGASNLLDILKLVPGFSVGVDAQGVFSLSIRGIWGIDGKILLTIDGIEQNELAFSTVVLNNRYSAESIKKIEIIRGPGTVAYGGSAELAVIKVTTYGAELNGTRAVFSTNLSSKGTHKNNLTFMSGGQLDNDLKYSFSGFIGSGDYANKDYLGIAGNSFDMDGNSNTEPFNLNLGLQYNNLNFRVFYDHYQYEDRIGIGGIGLFSNDFYNPANDFVEFTQNGNISFEALTLKLGYAWHFDDLEIKGNLTHTQQKPWYSFYPDRGPHSSKEEVIRNKGDVEGIYTLDNSSNWLIGISYYQEEMTLIDSYFLDASIFFDGENNRSLSDKAFYTQYETNLSWLNITAGGRYEDHGFAGSQFVPRLAFTRVEKNYHAKLVYNKAFKIPQFGTVATAELVGNPILGAEDMSIIEFELGSQLSPDKYLQANIFQQTIDNYIAYEPSLFANITAGQVKVLGGEVIFQAKTDWGDMSANYSYFTLESEPLSGFVVDGEPNKVLGIPNHMFKFSWSKEIGDQSHINLNGTFMGSRYACISDLVNYSCGEPQEINLQSEINIYYRKRFTHLSLGLGIANLLDEDIVYIQPYRGGQAPTPGLTRRLTLELEYRFD